MAMDPTLQQLIAAMPSLSVSELGHEQLRETMRQALANIPVTTVLPRVEDRTIAEGVGARIYWPVEDPEDLPVVVFYHGGGFVIGNLDTHDNVARSIAEQVGAVVVSVDYRLAPEHPYPAAVDDSFAALKWVADHAGELGADPTRLAVAGDSAGGNLSAVMTQLARDAGGPGIVYQLLWYPAVMADESLPSAEENSNAPMLSVADTAYFLTAYAGERTEFPPTLAPARAASLADLPPAYIATAQFDPLRDDGAAYARLLREAGVPVELHNAETLIHGYISFAALVPAAGEAFNASLAALKSAL